MQFNAFLHRMTENLYNNKAYTYFQVYTFIDINIICSQYFPAVWNNNSKYSTDTAFLWQEIDAWFNQKKFNQFKKKRLI